MSAHLSTLCLADVGDNTLSPHTAEARSSISAPEEGKSVPEDGGALPRQRLRYPTDVFAPRYGTPLSRVGMQGTRLSRVRVEPADNLQCRLWLVAI